MADINNAKGSPITPAKIERFCPQAVKLHVDIDPAEMNKILNQHFNAFKQAAAQPAVAFGQVLCPDNVEGARCII